MKVFRVAPYAPDVLYLIEQLNTFNLSNYPAEVCHLDPPEVLARENCIMIGAYDEGVLCGIGAVKFFEGYGEIKRMFVPVKFRGRGVSKLIIEELINIIRQNGLTIARLETGIRHEVALILYRKKGFVEREPFGDYGKTELNVYMEKVLN
jgi:putative acetyltransferase